MGAPAAANLSITAFKSGTTSPPGGTPSAPPSQKSFWTSTTTKASCSGSMRMDIAISSYALEVAPRPGRMSTHDRLGIVGALGQCRQSLAILPVSEGHGDGTEEPSALGAADRAARKRRAEFPFVQGQEPGQGRERSCGEERVLPGERGLAVPRADVLADVAAKDPLPHRRAQLLGDRLPGLDREIG